MTFRILILIAACLPAWGAGALVQPLIDFSVSRPLPGEEGKAAPAMATGDLADDFAWRGEGKRTFDSGTLSLECVGSENGAEISLAGPLWEKGRTLDLADLRGFHGPRCPALPARAIVVDASGAGSLDLSLRDSRDGVVWKATIAITPEGGPRSLVLPAEALQRVKSLRFTTGAGGKVRLRSLAMETASQPKAPAEELFLRSLAKLRRLHDPATGMLAARSEVAFGPWVALPGTGMHALAVAAASTDGIIGSEQARAEVRRIVATVLAIPTAKDFLPHFAMRTKDGGYVGTPKSGFSTIDTALTLQPLLSACRILELDAEGEAVRQAIRRIDWSEMIDERGFIRHGYQPDGKTIIAGSYRGWGGEAALCVLLEGMSRGGKSSGVVDRSGKPFRGHGFIAELQSLFYPDFDRPEKDAVSGAAWPAARRSLMAEHESYFTRHFPDSRAAREGVWGVSAGEVGPPGTPYAARGCDDPGIRWVHPHYQVMATCQLDRARIPEMIQAFEKSGIWYPLGLPEGMGIDFSYRRPLCCSLNAAFEALAAWHGMKGRGRENPIDRAALEEPMVREAMRRFYPAD